MSDILPEKWMKAAAVTVTVLAVLTAIASSRSSFHVAQTQVLTAQEGSKWSYYQAKSIKQNLAENLQKTLEVELLSDKTPEQTALLQKDLQELKANIARYDQEKTDIKADAEKTGADKIINARRGNQFSFSIIFFQIGIMMASVSALLKRKEMWLVGVISGCIASVFLVNGVFLLF